MGVSFSVTSFDAFTVGCTYVDLDPVKLAGALHAPAESGTEHGRDASVGNAVGVES